MITEAGDSINAKLRSGVALSPKAEITGSNPVGRAGDVPGLLFIAILFHQLRWHDTSMHWLSAHNRSEFLACPQLIRFESAEGREQFEPTLLIKGSTLLLKYIVLGAPMQLAFAMCDRRLICALRVFDDGDDGGILWSIVEREVELNGIRGLARGESLGAFLFNELAVNVAWNYLPTSGAMDRLSTWADSATLGRIDHAKMQASVFPLLDQLHSTGESDKEWIVLEIGGRSDWKAVHSHFITTSGSASLIDIFDTDEGSQQEQLGIWLTDNIRPFGVYHSPQVPKSPGMRELTDILLSHEFGAVLIESKTLSILAREQLPNRAKLKRDVSTHIGKAFGQLRGAIRGLKAGLPVTNSKGDALEIERDKPAHAVVLIPDFVNGGVKVGHWAAQK